jgi:hypothetical protein
MCLRRRARRSSRRRRQDVAHALFGRHQLALLVDHDLVERLRALDRAFGRLDLAGQQLEQCGLARAVGADHADAVAARDAEGRNPS